MPTPLYFFLSELHQIWVFRLALGELFLKFIWGRFQEEKNIVGRPCDPWWRHRSCDPNFVIFDFFLNIYNWPIVGKGMENVTKWDQTNSVAHPFCYLWQFVASAVKQFVEHIWLHFVNLVSNRYVLLTIVEFT